MNDAALGRMARRFKCQACVWHKPQQVGDGLTYGNCMVGAPRTSGEKWPTVFSGIDWCGKWSPVVEVPE